MIMKNVNKVLEDSGLSKNEVIIYLTLLEFGPSLAGKLSKESKVNRTSTYNALRGLLEKGIISYVIKANRKWFQPEEPERLIEFVKEQENNISSILPILKDMHKIPKEPKDVKLYYGYKGIKSIFQDIVREGKPNDVFGSEGQFLKKMPYFVSHYIKEVDKKGIKIRHIIREGRKMGKKSKTTEVRTLPLEVESPVSTNIYADKIAITIWTDPPEAVVIQSKTAAEAYRNFFDVVWKSAKKYED